MQDIQRKEAERDYEYKRTKEEIQSLRDLLNKVRLPHFCFKSLRLTDDEDLDRPTSDTAKSRAQA